MILSSCCSTGEGSKQQEIHVEKVNTRPKPSQLEREKPWIHLCLFSKPRKQVAIDIICRVLIKLQLQANSDFMKTRQGPHPFRGGKRVEKSSFSLFMYFSQFGLITQDQGKSS